MANAVDVLQPDITRVGSLTAWLKIAALAEQHHRTLAPHVLPEIGVHLACGLPHVKSVEYIALALSGVRGNPGDRQGADRATAKAGLGVAEIRHVKRW